MLFLKTIISTLANTLKSILKINSNIFLYDFESYINNISEPHLTLHDIFSSVQSQSYFYYSNNIVSLLNSSNTKIFKSVPMELEFLNVNTIESNAFASYSKLLTVSFPICSYIKSLAFQNCSNLTNIYSPLCKRIQESAFRSCSQLIINKSDFLSCEYLGSYAFASCTALTSVNFPNNLKIYTGCFKDCINLTTIYSPLCDIIYAQAFANCSNLKEVNFPNCLTIHSSAFTSCYAMKKIILSTCNLIHPYAFRYCSNLLSIYLYGSSICQLSNAGQTFNGSPIMISSQSGKILVPASLVEAYKSATNWAAFSSRIFAIEDYPPEEE